MEIGNSIKDLLRDLERGSIVNPIIDSVWNLTSLSVRDSVRFLVYGPVLNISVMDSVKTQLILLWK